LTHADDTDALPWVAAAALGESYPMPAYLNPYLSGGELDMDHIHTRIAELEALGVYS
jgi:hypothetical protein